MSNAQLKTVAGSAVATQERDPGTFPGMLKAFKSEIARALPKHINADRMCRIALTCFRQTPALAKCEPASIFAAVVQASQLGLEPGLNGRAYLIPYQDKTSGTFECQFVPGWKGLVELANRTGRAAVWTGAVFTGDDFEYALGDSPYVKHRPGNEDDPEKLIFTYAVGRIKGNDWPVIEVWTAEKILKHRNRYNKVGKRHYSFENWEMYARKVPLMQVLKYLPSSPELETAMALNDTFESGERQGMTIEGALAGSYEPPPPKAEGVDTDTGKVTEGNVTAPTYAYIRQSIEAATDKDGVDLAESLVDSLAENFRPELHELAKTRRAALAK